MHFREVLIGNMKLGVGPRKLGIGLREASDGPVGAVESEPAAKQDQRDEGDAKTSLPAHGLDPQKL
jgi:hypothetical protein